MCWEDVEIGQSEPFVTRLVTVDNVAVTIIANTNPNRSVLIISATSADGIRVLPDFDPTSTTGILVDTSAAGQRVISLQDHGRMVQSQWRAIATGAAPVTVTVIKVDLPGLGPLVGARKDGQPGQRTH